MSEYRLKTLDSKRPNAISAAVGAAFTLGVFAAFTGLVGGGCWWLFTWGWNVFS